MGSALRLLVPVELEELDHRPELRHGVVIGVAPVAAVEFAALQQAVALVLEIGVASGQVAGAEGDVVAAGAARLEQVAPGALLGAGLQELDVDVAEPEHADGAADPRWLAVIYCLRAVGIGGLAL